MATKAGTGAGGKLRTKIPLRPVTPYTRRSATTTTITKQHPSILKRLLDSASSLVYAGASTFLGAFCPRPPEISKAPQIAVAKQDQSGLAELKQMQTRLRVLEEEITSPAELAKYYMRSRPTSQAPRQDSNLLPTTPMTAVAQKTATGLRSLKYGVTPRSRGRSAMYHGPQTVFQKPLNI